MFDRVNQFLMGTYLVSRTLKHYPSVVIDPEQLTEPLETAKVFGRTAPFHLEIGSGKGTFLVNEAKRRPMIDFLGIEWARKYYRYAVDRVGRWSLTNVRLIRTEAAVFLRDYVRDQSVDCLHLYFPDPWPKQRHHKRRFVNQSNIELIFRVLKVGGELRIATDHVDYFRHIQSVLSENSHRGQVVEFHPTAGALTGEWVGTNFERKYLKEERSVYKIAVAKKPLSI